MIVTLLKEADTCSSTSYNIVKHYYNIQYIRVILLSANFIRLSTGSNFRDILRH